MPRPTTSTLSDLQRHIAIPAWQADPASRPLRRIDEVWTGQALIDVPVGTKADAHAAIQRASAAQPAWERLGAARRAAILRRFADLVYSESGWLLDIDQAETGKARWSGGEELLDVALTSRFYAARAARWLHERRIGGGFPGLSSALVRYEPVGVVGVIAPWNYPLSLSICDAVAALAAGNAVVLKPDSRTPLSALAAAVLLKRAGLPADVLQVVTGAGSQVGATIAAECDYLMFTGSSATGATLGATMGERLVGYSAELGGKNPLLVGPGVDVEWAARIAARACFANTGQLCISIERIYAVEASYDAFRRAFVAAVERMRVAPGYDYRADVGSLISADQLATVREHVDDAVGKGARVLAGGRARPDLGPTFFEPTVLEGVPGGAVVARAETFGPVVSLYRVADLDAAVAAANDSDYGLNASVLCATDAEGMAVARRLQTGMVNVNEGYGAAWSALAGPSGGRKRSGLGYRHGVEGLRKYTHAKTIGTQSRLMSLAGPTRLPQGWWPPLLQASTRLMRYLPGR